MAIRIAEGTLVHEPHVFRRVRLAAAIRQRGLDDRIDFLLVIELDRDEALHVFGRVSQLELGERLEELALEQHRELLVAQHHCNGVVVAEILVDLETECCIERPCASDIRNR